MCCFHLLGPTALGVLSDLASKRVAAREEEFGNLLRRVPKVSRTTLGKGGGRGTESIVSHDRRSTAMAGRHTGGGSNVFRS